MIFLLLFSLSFSVQALELNSQSFYICTYKTATQIKNRNVRIHYFPEEKKCAVFYTIKGIDKIIASGRWLPFCKTKGKELVENLEKALWKCKFSKESVKVFYPFKEQKTPLNNTSSEG